MAYTELVPFLGESIELLLGSPSFLESRGVRSVDEGPPPEIAYEFSGGNVAVTCDAEDIVRCIFLRGREGEKLAGMSFAVGQRALRKRMGRPSATGKATKMPVLGAHGPWDRFDFAGASVHFEYAVGGGSIVMLTLMDPRRRAH